MGERPETIGFWRGRLPHWEVADGLYFVTIHLSGAIPKPAAGRIREMSRELESKKGDQRTALQRRVFAEMEKWLDHAKDARYLEEPRVAAVVQDGIGFQVRRQTWHVLEHVTMPSHVHLYVKVLSGRLRDSLRAFKRWTGHEAGKLMGLSGKRFWQDEWFDHWARTAEEGEKIKRYIRQNPVEAGLVSDYRAWPYGSWRSVAE